MLIHQLHEADDEDYIKHATMIYKECKPFLEAIDYRLVKYKLYRGMAGSNDVQVKKVRLTNRNPSALPVEVHKALNVVFSKQYQHPFRNGLFVTGTRLRAEFYGDTFFTFPVGDFKFLWSESIGDILTVYENINPEDDNLSSNELEGVAREVVDYVSDRYTQKDLKKAITSGNEIMMWVANYVAVPTHNLSIRTLEAHVLKIRDADK